MSPEELKCRGLLPIRVKILTFLVICSKSSSCHHFGCFRHLSRLPSGRLQRHWNRGGNYPPTHDPICYYRCADHPTQSWAWALACSSSRLGASCDTSFAFRDALGPLASDLASSICDRGPFPDASDRPFLSGS